MDRKDFDAWTDRISSRANQLWEAAGRPEGSRDGFTEEARELIAIEEVALPGLDPEEAAEPVVEEAVLQRNLGEFPTLRDQGEEQTYPDPYEDDDSIRLSDGDASATGGVLPQDIVPRSEEMPDVSLADADITSSSIDADDGPVNDDLNDDGMPDRTDLDPEGEMDAGHEYEDAAADDPEDEDGDRKPTPH